MSVHEDKIEGALDRLLKLWPLGLMLFGAIAGYIKLQINVSELQRLQERWQANTEQRREGTRGELEAIRTRLTKLEVASERTLRTVRE